MSNFYTRLSTNLSDYKTDQNVIIKRKCIKHLCRVQFEEEKVPLSHSIEWYPFTYSYYSYTEDVDALSRVKNLLGTKPSFESLTSLKDRDKLYLKDEYSERQTQIQYLYSPPVSFLILGKPELGEQELGRLLSNYWRCVYIHPQSLVEEEITSGTRAGKCIEFNLRCGRSIGTDVILRLLEKRVKSKSAQHRGFVICGFPTIPNNLFEEEPISSESVVFNVQEIFEDVFDKATEVSVLPIVLAPTSSILPEEASEEAVEEQENESEKSAETIDLPSQHQILFDIGSCGSENICGPATSRTCEDQLNFVFNLFHKPFLVIYIVCNNSDVISQRKDYRFDFINNAFVDLQQEFCDRMVYSLFSTTPGTAKDESPEDLIDVINKTEAFDSSRVRQLVKMPKDFYSAVVSVLDCYRYSVLPFIDRYIMMHDPQYTIRVDGRLSTISMFNAVRIKLTTLPVQKVLLPEKLLVPKELAGEDDVSEDVVAEGMSLEESFEAFRSKRCTSPMFKWSLSEWGYKCPVSMKEGDYRNGKSKYAVQFMNKIFFLSSGDAYIKFYLNPRSFLLPPYPKSSCKIFVMGPPCSGRTTVSRCLGYLLNGEVLNYTRMCKDFVEKKRNMFEDKIRTAALVKGITILNDVRLKEWEKSEDVRREKIQHWLEVQQKLLEDTLALTAKLEPADEVEMVIEMSSFPVALSFNQQDRSLDAIDEISEQELIKRTIKELKDLIRENGLPCFDDIGLCAALVENPDMLLDYLPPPLQPRDCDVKPATVDDEFVVEYAEKAVQTASFENLAIDSDEIVEMYVDLVTQMEQSSREPGSEEGYWIIDSFRPSREVLSKIPYDYRPKDIFVLEAEAGYEFLQDKTLEAGEHTFRDFRNFFISMGKTDAAWRSPQIEKNINQDEVVQDILDDILSRVISAEDHENIKRFLTPNTNSAIGLYQEELHEFIEDWTDLEQILSDLGITVTHFSVTDKTLEELLKDVVKVIDNRTKYLARPYTEEDFERELQDFSEPAEIHGEAGEEIEEQEPTDDMFLQNRRFGDTFIYCPVALHEHWVLWRGKDEFSTSFASKVYLISSEEAQRMFIEDPYRYLLIDKPWKLLPPPRICIVGSEGSGKSTVSKALARNLGLYKIDFFEKIKQLVAPGSEYGLNEIIKLGIAGENGALLGEYMSSNEPLPPDFLNQILSSFWFEDPIKTFGFVLDGFPARPSDVDYMTANFTIPDVVIELTTGQSEIEKRLVEKFLKEWNDAFDQRLENIARKHRDVLSLWETRRKAKFDELMEIRKQERYASKMEEIAVAKNKQELAASERPYMEDLAEVDEDKFNSTDHVKSQISFDSVFEEAVVAEINEILDEQIPEPVFDDEEQQTLEDALEKFVSNLQNSYALNLDFLIQTRENCERELIPWFTVDAGMDEDKVFAQVMRVAKEYKFRNSSHLERVYNISVDIADKLLSNGYYFLSKFGKTCPVQIYESDNPVQMYLPLEKRLQIYPVIHRQYIYFLAKSENRYKFIKDPLKYIFHHQVKFPLIPLKISVTGPPKSGKTVLATRLRDEFGLKLITRGQAARYVLTFLPFSELARQLENVLRCGWVLTSEMAMKCVEAMTLDGKSATQGFVLDGFPESIDEVRHLATIGLTPHLVIDLKADHLAISAFLESDVGKHNVPCFSKKFNNYRHGKWLLTEGEFREWLDKEYQILAKIPVNRSKWGIWTAAYALILAVFSEIKYYFNFCHLEIVLRVSNMQITSEEFEERRSSYSHYCPSCLYYDNVLVSGGDPPDRTGLVQFKQHYYYLCRDHIETFIDDPERFVSPYNPRSLPHDLPTITKLTDVPENCYENGLCVVCNWKNQPMRVLKQGNIIFAVSYKEKIYLFDTLACQTTFLREPQVYFAKSINYKGNTYPSLSYKELPTLGMLQQYAAKQLTRAIVNTGILRPVIPGLDISCSALLNIALHLKLNNPKTSCKFLPLYEEAQSKFTERRTNLMIYLARMKNLVNPYLYYDEPMPKLVDPLFVSPTETIYAKSLSKSSSVDISSTPNVSMQSLDNISNI